MVAVPVAVGMPHEVTAPVPVRLSVPTAAPLRKSWSCEPGSSTASRKRDSYAWGETPDGRRSVRSESPDTSATGMTRAPCASRTTWKSTVPVGSPRLA